MPGKEQDKEQNGKPAETFTLPGLHKKTISPKNDDITLVVIKRNKY